MRSSDAFRELLHPPELQLENPLGPNDPVIQFEDVHKRFGTLVVLDGVSLDVFSGDRLVILGPSGTGKSVLLRHIVRLTRPDHGTVRLLGHDLTRMARPALYALRLQVGMLFQGAALLDSMTVRDNVVLGLRAHTDLSEAELDRIAEEKLTLVDMPGIGDRMPSQLSGGMRKRVGLARAIAMEPRIVLYDEPTTGLDPVNADVINTLITQVSVGEQATSVLVTHDMTSAFKVGTRFVMLAKGHIIFDGNAAELRATDDPRVSGFIAGRAEALDLLQD